MEDRLADLSHGLNDAFADTVSRIQRLPESRSRLSMAALMWLTHTPRALTESELSDALAVRSGQKVLNVKYRPTTKMILECCQGLVVVDAKGYVHLAHYAIHEYMRDHSGQLFPRAQATMALTCLRYLLCENFQDGPWQAESLESRMYQFPFLDYSSMYWGQFTRWTETDEEVWAALLEFFASPPAMSTANQVRQFSRGYKVHYWNAAECRSFGALHHASRHGLERAVSRLLEDGNHDVNVLTEMGLTPIIAAAAAGHTHTMRRLLAKGADPYLCNWYGNALHCAAESGKAATVRALVAWGMNPNDWARDESRTSDGGNRGRTYLGCALDKDAADAFEALVDAGADISRQCEHHIHGHLFLTAASWGDHQVIALMLRREWAHVDLRDADGNTALHYAAVAGDPTTVGLLLEAGVDINAENNIGHTALVHAEARGEQMVARLLLDAGATPLNVALGTVVFSDSLFI
jgi:ankyrin repeat protein